MIRIIYFCPSENMYGDNIALLRIMPYLVKCGVIPFFIVGFEGKLTHYLKENNYKYIVSHNRIWNLYDLDSPIKNFIIGGLWRLKHYFSNKSSVKRIAFMLRDFDADLVHSNSSNSSFGYYLAKELGVKHVWHLREYGKLDANKQFYPCFKHFLHKIDRKDNYAIAITPLIYDYFQRKEHSTTIYDGVVDEKNIPEISFQKDKYFLYVGRLFEKKGIELILDAFYESQSIDTEYKLLIAGSGNPIYETYLKEKVKRYSMADRILFLGYRQDVSSLMSRAKALIVASDFEGFGFITAEAMFAGCYVVGKDTAGTKLQFDNLTKLLGYNIGARFMHLKDLTDIIKSIMLDKLNVQDHLHDVQDAIVKLYGIQRSAKEVMAFYKTILKK